MATSWTNITPNSTTFSFTEITDKNVASAGQPYGLLLALTLGGDVVTYDITWSNQSLNSASWTAKSPSS